MARLQATYGARLAAQAPLLRTFARYLVCDDRADDAVQDAMVAALAHQTPPRSLSAWMRQIVRNRVHETSRRDRRRQARELRAPGRDSIASFEEAVVRTELIDALVELLSTLEEPFQTALRLRFYDEFSAAEIARACGCPIGTVHWRIHEGLRRVRKRLDERFGGRKTWCGALLVFTLPPPPSLTTTGTNTMKTLLVAAAAATAITGGVVVTQTLADTDPNGTVLDGARPPAGMRAEAVRSSRRGVDPAFFPAAPTTTARSDDDPPPCPTCAAAGESVTAAVWACIDRHAPNMMDGVYEVDVLVGRDEGLLALDQAHVRPHVDGADALAGCITGSDAVIAPVASDGPDAFMIKVEFKKDPTAATPIEDVSFRGELEGRIIDTAGLPRRGKNAHEVASVVVCSDFECPFCDRARDTIEELVDTHETVAVFHLNFPLDSHPNAVLKAKAALAAHQQGAFWAMYDALFDRPELTTRADLVALASELELDRERFAVDLDSEATEASVRQQRQTCEALGANATPTYFVNGRKLQGALPVERLSEVLAKDLPE